MNIISYIKLQRIWFIGNLSIFIIINCILFSSVNINLSLPDIIYMDMLIMTIQISSIIFDIKNHKKIYADIIKNEDIKTCEYKKNFYIDILLEISKKQNKVFLEREELYKRKINELQEYLTQWVHDIKVNISVCDLLLEENEYNNTDIFCNQIEKIKFNVNQILYITRATHYNQDISCEEVDLCTEVKNAIKENAFFFINKNISIETNIKPFTTTSDKKWVNYIFCQILNNSSKYTQKNGFIKIYSEETQNSYCINIKDNGIGIAKEDIERIFCKGFTGKNGRTGTKSTGMGLYYAKNMADLLHIGLTVSSKEGSYTNFSVIFYKLSDYYDLLLN